MAELPLAQTPCPVSPRRCSAAERPRGEPKEWLSHPSHSHTCVDREINEGRRHRLWLERFLLHGALTREVKPMAAEAQEGVWC